MIFSFYCLGGLPLTLRPGDWYFPSSAVILLAFGALWIWAWRAAAAGPSRLASPAR